MIFDPSIENNFNTSPSVLFIFNTSPNFLENNVVEFRVKFLNRNGKQQQKKKKIKLNSINVRLYGKKVDFYLYDRIMSQLTIQTYILQKCVQLKLSNLYFKINACHFRHFRFFFVWRIEKLLKIEFLRCLKIKFYLIFEFGFLVIGNFGFGMNESRQLPFQHTFYQRAVSLQEDEPGLGKAYDAHAGCFRV